MNISYNWLKQYIATDLSASEISTILTDVGLEVDGLEKIETIKGGLEGVVIGEVLTCEAHADSDHLNVTTVDVGAGEPLQIVCGAANCRAGLKVVCATVGAVLYPSDGEGEFKIKKSKIRGVESFGMLCAEDEIGLGEGHDGIMELPADAKVGMTAKEFFGIEDDYLIEVGLTPNRIDAASHIGVARDLVAYLRSKGASAEVALPSVAEYKKDSDAMSVEVVVEAKDAAPHYAVVAIKGCKIAPSPDWMQNRLRAVGINPKNNLVDITNYVLHELGQPLHAFDAAKVAGGKIVVKRCAEGTKFVTLDEVERTLSADDLMICSAEKPMCIAGVFGGLESGVSDSTTDIILESAYFNPVSVRKSAKRFGLSTDASFRFERGIDPNIQIYALKRAAMLYKELAGGEIASDIVDVESSKIEDFKFEISLNRARKLIGKQIEDSVLRTIIAALDIKVESESKDEAGGAVLSVAVPAYRVDVQREADLIEDILRIYGYNNVEVPTAVKSTLTYSQRPDKNRLMNLAADYMSANGYTEIMSNSLTKASYYESLEGYPAEKCVKIINPLSADLNVMRQTLLFNTLEAVELNANRKNGDLRIYEFGNCYYYNADKVGAEDKDGKVNILAPYDENYRLSIAVTGAASPASWREKGNAQASFFTLREMVERLLSRFGMDIYSLKEQSLECGLFSEGVSYMMGPKEILRMGVVSQKLRKDFDLKSDVFYAEVDFDALIKTTKKQKIAVSELSKYPEVKRDLALLIDKCVSFSALRDVAFQTDKKLLKSVTLFDVYEGDKLPAGKKSYALGFTLEDKTQTLTDKVIEKVMANLQRNFEEKLGAQLR
ncbi:MAG: phenylalanine--tRNA ligase subunit beta [Rikenellaceae bacterium]